MLLASLLFLTLHVTVSLSLSVNEEVVELDSIKFNVPESKQGTFDEIIANGVKWVSLKPCGDAFVHALGVPSGKTPSNTIYYQKFKKNVTSLTLVDQHLYESKGDFLSENLRFSVSGDCSTVGWSMGDEYMYVSSESGEVIDSGSACSSIQAQTPTKYACLDPVDKSIHVYDAQNRTDVQVVRQDFGPTILQQPIIIDYVPYHTGAHRGCTKECFTQLYSPTLNIPEGKTYSVFMYHGVGRDRARLYAVINDYTVEVARRAPFSIRGPSTAYFYAKDFTRSPWSFKVSYGDAEGVLISYGCNSELLPSGQPGTSLFACPKYSLAVNGQVKEDVGAVLVTDANMTVTSYYHPPVVDKGGFLFGSRLAVSGKSIYSAFYSSGGTVKIMRLDISGVTLGIPSTVYDTGFTDMNFQLHSESDGTLLYIVRGQIVTVLAKVTSVSDNKLFPVGRLRLKGTDPITSIVYDYNTGTALLTPNTRHITGFIVPDGDSIFIPDTESELIYNVYTDNLHPVSSRDYIMLTVEQAMSFYSTWSAQYVIDLYKNTPLWVGFLVDHSTDRVKYVLKRRVVKPEKFGELQVSESGLTFYEMRPILTKFFGWNEKPSPCIPITKCMYVAPTVIDARRICQNITRCEGYHGGCVVEARSYTTCEELEDGRVYYSKKFRHDVFKELGEDPMPAIVISGVLAVVHTLYLAWLDKRLSKKFEN